MALDRDFVVNTFLARLVVYRTKAEQRIAEPDIAMSPSEIAVGRPSHSNVVSIFPIRWVSLRDTRDVTLEEWHMLLGEAGNVRKAANTAAPVSRHAPALRLFRHGVFLIGIGFLLAALTAAFETVVLPVAAGAALFVGCSLAADAVERYRCVD